ncbi:hypothetical protein N9222_02635 [Pseudomonadales bacterium]|nr:hypothetical protein [Pseudomonadales bacterium]
MSGSPQVKGHAPWMRTMQAWGRNGDRSPSMRGGAALDEEWGAITRNAEWSTLDAWTDAARRRKAQRQSVTTNE